MKTDTTPPTEIISINNTSETTSVDFKTRLQCLAGIIKDDTLATLYIPQVKETLNLKRIPTWWEQLKYKICGFKCSVIRHKPQVIKNNITIFEPISGVKLNG
jgi:hypothetical protein